MQPPKVWLGNQKDFRFVWNAINKVDTILFFSDNKQGYTPMRIGLITIN